MPHAPWRNTWSTHVIIKTKVLTLNFLQDLPTHGLGTGSTWVSRRHNGLELSSGKNFLTGRGKVKPCFPGRPGMILLSNPLLPGPRGGCVHDRQRWRAGPIAHEHCPRDHAPRIAADDCFHWKAAPSPQAKTGNSPARVLWRWKPSHSFHNFVRTKSHHQKFPGVGGGLPCWVEPLRRLPEWTGAQKRWSLDLATQDLTCALGPLCSREKPPRKPLFKPRWRGTGEGRTQQKLRSQILFYTKGQESQFPI